MNLTRDVKSISYFKAHATEIVDELGGRGGVMVLTKNGEPCAVVMDVAEYEREQETLALLKMLLMAKKDFDEGRTIPLEKAMRSVLDKYKDR